MTAYWDAKPEQYTGPVKCNAFVKQVKPRRWMWSVCVWSPHTDGGMRATSGFCSSEAAAVKQAKSHLQTVAVAICPRFEDITDLPEIKVEAAA